MKKQKKYKAKKKNGLVRRSVVWTAQTDWHLRRWAAHMGYGEKDLGRVVDKLARIQCAEERSVGRAVDSERSFYG